MGCIRKRHTGDGHRDGRRARGFEELLSVHSVGGTLFTHTLLLHLKNTLLDPIASHWRKGHSWSHSYTLRDTAD